MGLAFTSKANPMTSDSWGTAFLVFFPDDHHHNNGWPKPTSENHPNTSNFLMHATTKSSSSIKRSISNNLFTKAQSTISICALLVFLTLLLFTLSTFEPTTTSIHTPRRFLSQTTPYLNPPFRHSFALQGMGTLYRRGTEAMPDLVVAHLTEDVNEDEFRLFLRLLHRSGLTAKADVAFLSGVASKFDSLIREENDSFLKLVQHHKGLKNNGNTKTNSVLSFDLTQFVKAVKDGEEVGEPLWGKKTRGNYSGSSAVLEVNNVEGGELTRLSYGSFVGFEVSELDPENSLSGFLDHIPMSLRRWACYPMLLGRVRRNFKHIALVDVKHLLLLGDPLVRVRSKSPESVHVSLRSSDKHSKRNSEKTQSHDHSVNSEIITGGARGIRRLCNAMLTEIVRVAMQHKKKSSVTESGVLSQLVGNEHVLKNINLITSTESIPEASSLTGLIQRGGNSIRSSISNTDIINGSIIMKILCSCLVDSFVYKNC